MKKKSESTPVPKKPSAKARTVSMLSGRTDLESKDARDGSRSDEERRRRRAPAPKYHWVSDKGEAYWRYVDSRDAEVGHVSGRPGGRYAAFVGDGSDGQLLEFYETLLDASIAVEAAIQKPAPTLMK